MGAWERYERRRDVLGRTKREAKFLQTIAVERRRMVDSLSYREVQINGIPQSVMITRTADMDSKNIYSMPGEHLEPGGVVSFADNMWLIVEIDADGLVYEHGIMRQCNHILRWIGRDGTLKEKYSIVEDGTKYIAGERTHEMIAIGEARIAVTVGKDKDTLELDRGFRFLIDDTDSKNVLAYQITKPNRTFGVYNGRGVFRYVMTEVQLTDADNKELRIADYTEWHPEAIMNNHHVDSDYTVAEIVAAATEDAYTPPDDNKEVWL